MSLLWVPREHVAFASAVWECTLTECGAIPSPVPARKCRPSWISLDQRGRHTCERVRKAITLYRTGSHTLSRSRIGGGGGVTKFVPVLGRDGTKIAPPEDLFY